MDSSSSSSDNGYDLEEELGPMTYQCTMSLLPDDKRTTTPTRFELFRARKDFEQERRRRISLEHKWRQLHQMQRALSECSDLLYTEVMGKFPPMDKLINSVVSRVMTRSMTTNARKFLLEAKSISTALCEKSKMLTKVKKCDNLETFLVIFTRDVSELKDRILAVKQLSYHLLRYLEM